APPRLPLAPLLRLEQSRPVRYGKSSGQLRMRSLSRCRARLGLVREPDMRFSFPIRVWGGIVLILAAPLRADEPAASPLAEARRLLLEGKYAEAEDAYQALAGDNQVESAVGKARCQEAVGRREKAGETLAAAAQAHPDNASLPAESARLALIRGDYE